MLFTIIVTLMLLLAEATKESLKAEAMTEATSSTLSKCNSACTSLKHIHYTYKCEKTILMLLLPKFFSEFCACFYSQKNHQ